jgi:hypothetical protein
MPRSRQRRELGYAIGAAKTLATRSTQAYINARLTGMRVGTEVAKRGGL